MACWKLSRRVWVPAPLARRGSDRPKLDALQVPDRRKPFRFAAVGAAVLMGDVGHQLRDPIKASLASALDRAHADHRDPRV